MFAGWSEFFVMAGGAAAVLIGLIFVVISLMQDRPRSQVLAGTRQCPLAWDLEAFGM